MRRLRLESCDPLLRLKESRDGEARATMASPGVLQLEAQAPTTLQHQTWILPKSHYGEPRVQLGRVEVHGDEHDWLITAGDCKLLRVEMALR